MSAAVASSNVLAAGGRAAAVCQQFADFKLDGVKVTDPIANKGGKGKTAYVRVPGFGRYDRVTFMTPWLEVAFRLKPSMGDKEPPASPQEMEASELANLRLRLTVRVPDDSAFTLKSRELDEIILAQALGKPKEWLSAEKQAKLRQAKDPRDALAMAQSSMVKAGSDREDGTSYEPNFSMNVDGWGAYIASWTLKTMPSKDKEKKDKKMVEEVTYADRLPSRAEDHIPEDAKRTTRFFEVKGNGKFPFKAVKCERDQPVYVETTAADGTVTKSLLKRYVSPADVDVGDSVSAMFDPSRVYVADNFGVTCSATEVLIRKVVRRPKAKVQGLEERVNITDEELLALEAAQTEEAGEDPTADASKATAAAATVDIHASTEDDGAGDVDPAASSTSERLPASASATTGGSKKRARGDDDASEAEETTKKSRHHHRRHRHTAEAGDDNAEADVEVTTTAAAEVEPAAADADAQEEQ